MAGAQQRLAFADGLRGLAACWVVLFHMSEGKHIEALRDALPAMVFRVFFSMGDLGVPVFFVLSGYVMALTAARLEFTAAVGVRFVVRRLVRLMPAYYFAIALVLVLSIVKNKVLGQGAIYFDFDVLAAHALLVQGLLGIKNIDPVFWTLCVEIQFYIAFAMLMWASVGLSSVRNGYQGWVVVLVFSSAVALLWPLRMTHGSIWSGGFLPYWYCFMAGVWACKARDGSHMTMGCALGYALVVLAAGVCFESGAAVTAAVTALLLMLAFYRGKEDRWLSARWIQFLGLISYSLYLIHNPLTGASFNIAKRFLPPGAAAEVVGMLVVLVVCISASFLAYLLIERRSIELSRKIRLTAQPGALAARGV